MLQLEIWPKLALPVRRAAVAQAATNRNDKCLRLCLQAEAALGEQAWRDMCRHFEATAPEAHATLLPLLAELAPAFQLGTEPSIARSRASSLRQSHRRASIRKQSAPIDSTCHPERGTNNSTINTGAGTIATTTVIGDPTAQHGGGWAGMRTVVLRRNHAGYLGVTVSGGAEHDMLPAISVQAGSAGPQILSGHLSEGDELLAIDGELAVGLTHAAVIGRLRAVGRSVSLSVLPITTRLRATSTQDMAVHVFDASVPLTTRAMQTNEEYGDAYYFVDPAAFLFLLEEGHFSEWGELGGHFYGTLASSLELRCPTDPEDTRMVARAGNIHVCHLRRNSHGVYGVVIRGGREQKRLAYISAVGDVALSPSSPSRPLTGDAILSINGVSTVDATTAEMARLIAATQGGTLRLLLLAQCMQPGSVSATAASGFTLHTGMQTTMHTAMHATSEEEAMPVLQHASRRPSMVTVLQAARQRIASTGDGCRGVDTHDFAWDNLLLPGNACSPPHSEVDSTSPAPVATTGATGLYTRNAPPLRSRPPVYSAPGNAPPALSALNRAPPAFPMRSERGPSPAATVASAVSSYESQPVADDDASQLVAALEAAAVASEEAVSVADDGQCDVLDTVEQDRCKQTQVHVQVEEENESETGDEEEEEEEELPPLPAISMEPLHGECQL